MLCFSRSEWPQSEFITAFRVSSKSRFHKKIGDVLAAVEGVTSCFYTVFKEISSTWSCESTAGANQIIFERESERKSLSGRYFVIFFKPSYIRQRKNNSLDSPARKHILRRKVQDRGILMGILIILRGIYMHVIYRLYAQTTRVIHQGFVSDQSSDVSGATGAGCYDVSGQIHAAQAPP